ncbi:MAG: formyltransferase family protein [bacterium]
MKVLFISKDRQDPYISSASAFIQKNFVDPAIFLAKPGQSIPENVLTWQGDLLISYLCPWVLPAPLLANARFAALNFHPATPDYPGTGCTNFAIYNGEKEYGVMCHHMVPTVDSGKVVAVRRFPILPNESVYSLTQRCYAYMLELFYEIISGIVMGKPLPESCEHWTRKPYRRVELNELKRLELDMPLEEIQRRVRATAYPGTQGAYFEIDGMRFEYVPEENK